MYINYYTIHNWSVPYFSSGSDRVVLSCWKAGTDGDQWTRSGLEMCWRRGCWESVTSSLIGEDASDESANWVRTAAATPEPPPRGQLPPTQIWPFAPPPLLWCKAVRSKDGWLTRKRRRGLREAHARDKDPSPMSLVVGMMSWVESWTKRATKDAFLAQRNSELKSS